MTNTDKSRILRPVVWMALFSLLVATPLRADTVDDDAQAVVNARLRLDRLQYNQSRYRTTPEETVALKTVGETIHQIEKKYDVGTPLFTRASEFTGKVAKLYGEQSQPARRAWLEDQYPEVQQVVADYADETHRKAALSVLAGEFLYDSYGWVQSEKFRAYRNAMGMLTDAQRKLAEDHRFHFEVLEKYLPAAAANSRSVQAYRRREDISMLALLGLVLAGLVVPWIAAGSYGWRTPIAAHATNDRNPLALPEKLSVVRLRGREYAVSFQAGQVLEEKTWTETHVSASTSGGQSYVTGNTVQTTPVNLHLHSTVVQKDRVWIRDLAGGECAWTFSDSAFVTRQGQIISFISARLRGRRDNPLMCYNHTTGQFDDIKGNGINKIARIPGFRPWAAATLIGMWLLFISSTSSRYQMTGVVDGRSVFTLETAIGAAVVFLVAWMYTLLIKRVFRHQMRRKFYKEYYPAFQQFFQQVTPVLQQHFKNA